MAGPGLPTNITAGASGHIAHTNTVNGYVNLLDTTFLTPNTDGDVLTWDGTSTTAKWEAPGAGGATDAELRASYGHPLDSFAGANDDAKLTTALTDAAAQTFPFTILFGNEQRTFTTANRIAFDGMRIQGPPGYGLPERSSSTKMPGRVHLNFSGPWFTQALNGDVWSASLHNLSFTGGGGASGPTVIGQNGTGGWYALSMRDIFSSSLRTVVGTQANKALLVAASFTGDWEINNCYNGAFHMGGSDNVFWSDGALIDSGTAFNSAGSANGQYHVWFDYMEKSLIGPLYMTAEGAWNGIRVQGPSNPATSGGGNLGGPLTFTGLRLEGRNAGAPCNGSLFRIEGGSAVIRDSWISYGMASPATPGHSPQDAGVVHQSNGILIMDGCSYDKATSIALSVPFVYVAAGECRISTIMRGSKGGSWSTTRPTVDEVTASTVTADSSVTVT